MNACGGYRRPACEHTRATLGYEALTRIASNDVGVYTYGPGLQAGTSPAPLHAALSVTGRGYTGAYDATGDEVCRAPTSTQTCASGQTATGQQLAYDNERRQSTTPRHGIEARSPKVVLRMIW
ncbi:MAG: hypothetical protein ACHQ4H_14645 [Ktedonobacterales bacterium]|jgi:hypothetical protein